MDPKDASTRAQTLLETERERRPGWRDGGQSRPAPDWFRGQELNLVDERERRELYLANDVRRRIQPWIAPAMLMPTVPTFVRDMRAGTDHVFWLVVAIAWAAAFAGALMLRRRNIVASARRTLRESKDWPQRLDAARTPLRDPEPDA